MNRFTTLHREYSRELRAHQRNKQIARAGVIIGALAITALIGWMFLNLGATRTLTCLLLWIALIWGLWGAKYLITRH